MRRGSLKPRLGKTGRKAFFMKKVSIFLAIFLVCSGFVLSASAAPSGNEGDSIHHFNTLDKSYLSNGNVEIAVNIIRGSSQQSIWQNAREMPVSKITRSLYSSLGKLVKVTGTIYKIEQLPPSELFQGSWYEVLILADDPNNILGVTTVDLVFSGDASKMDPGSIVTCAGYFVGTAIAQNAFGAQVEEVVVIGNVARLSTVPMHHKFR